jgi:hypothetical protein
MDLEWIVNDFPSHRRRNIRFLCGKKESSSANLHYLVNNNVLPTFVEGLPALRQILVTFDLPISRKILNGQIDDFFSCFLFLHA